MDLLVKEYLAVRDFEDLRHYKNRESLPWIKLQQALLDDPSFISVDAAQRGHYLMLCLLAARLKNRILYDTIYLGRAMRLDGPVNISPLIQAGLVEVIREQSAIKPEQFAIKREPSAIECEQPAVREKSTRDESTGEESTRQGEKKTEREEGRVQGGGNVRGGSSGGGGSKDAMTPIGAVKGARQHKVFDGKRKPEDEPPAKVQTSAPGTP